MNSFGQRARYSPYLTETEVKNKRKTTAENSWRKKARHLEHREGTLLAPRQGQEFESPHWKRQSQDVRRRTRHGGKNSPRLKSCALAESASSTAGKFPSPAAKKDSSPEDRIGIQGRKTPICEKAKDVLRLPLREVPSLEHDTTAGSSRGRTDTDGGLLAAVVVHEEGTENTGVPP